MRGRRALLSITLRRAALISLLATRVRGVESWTIPSTFAAAPMLASRWVLENPHHSAAAISSVRGILGDSIAQRLEGSNSFDARRTATYVSWSNLVAELYTRPWNCFVVERCFPAFVGEVLSLRNLLASVAIDNFLLSPLVYYPLFYLYKDAASGCFDFRKALAQYRRELWPQLRLLWKVWIPANLVSFALVPPHLRVAYNGLVGTLWVLALSRNTNLLATMGDACVCAIDDTECSVRRENRPWLVTAMANNWVFLLSFLVLQTATGAMVSIGILWLSLLLWAGFS